MILILNSTAIIAKEKLLSISGQYKVRYEAKGNKDFKNDTAADFFQHRARLGVNAKSKKVQAFIQLQNVRKFGEEKDTLKDYSSDNLDMHLAYLQTDLNERELL